MEARRGSHPAESWRAFEERTRRDQVRTCYRTDPCSASEGASAATSIRHSCRQIKGYRPATLPTAWRSLSWPMSWNPKFSRPEAWSYHVCWVSVCAFTMIVSCADSLGCCQANLNWMKMRRSSKWKRRGKHNAGRRWQTHTTKARNDKKILAKRWM